MSAYATDRIMLFDRRDRPLGDLSPDDVLDCLWSLEINGEHSMTVYVTRALPDDLRALTQDGTGKLHEWVLDTPDKEHRNGRKAIGKYRFVWSLQADLMGVQCAERRPGIPNPVSASVALASVLADTNRWQVGTVDVSTFGGLSTYNKNAWECLSDLVSVFGGEVDAQIEVDLNGVVSRCVALREHIGSTTVTRRFDWGYDVTGIDRNSPPGPRYCRVKPLGKGEAVYGEDGDVSTYTRRITIEDVNDGIDYISDSEAEELFKLPDGSGQYEYPTKIVVYEDIDDESALLATAIEDLHNHTRPAVSYEATVEQYEQAGMDVQGVSLGDNIHIVDRGFDGDVPLRLEGRVIRVQMQGISPVVDKRTSLTIGRLQTTLTDVITRLDKNVSSATSRVTSLEAASSSTAEYLDNLIDHLNAMINAEGGYFYITRGQGTRTYDSAVSDPLVGSEASKVVETKGGAIRIANSRTSGGDWDWKSVFVSGHIAAELVTAAQIVAGYIGSSGDTYIDLDSHTVQLGLSNGPHVVVDSTGMQVYNGSTSLGFFGYESGVGIVRVGQATQGNVVMSGNGYVDIRRGSEVVAHFGYGNNAPYFTLGSRFDASAVIGKYSMTVGYSNQSQGQCAFAQGWNAFADGDYSFAFGYNVRATGDYSFAGNGHATADDAVALRGSASGLKSVAIQGTASAQRSVAIGSGALASEINSTAIGYEAKASNLNQVAIGQNASLANTVAIGFGMGPVNGHAETGMILYKTTGALWVKGQITNTSDRRLKEHVAYLGDDAFDFIRKLKPALFVKDGERHLGFYAQDVVDAEPEEWDTDTVRDVHVSDDMEFDPLTLDYNALIAPLVAYAQGLERRIDQQQQQIDELTERLKKLEGRR